MADNRFKIEQLEQRIMLSADPLFAAAWSDDDALITSDTALEVVPLTLAEQEEQPGCATDALSPFAGADFDLFEGLETLTSDVPEQRVEPTLETQSSAPAPATQDIHTHWQQSHTDTLVIALGAGDLASGQVYEQITISGLASLSGNLDIRWLGEHNPVVGEVFDIFTYGAVEGMFAEINGQQLGDGLYWQLVRSADKLQLVVTQRLDQGDALASLFNSIREHTSLTAPVEIRGEHLRGEFDFQPLQTTSGLKGHAITATHLQVDFHAGIDANGNPYGAQLQQSQGYFFLSADGQLVGEAAGVVNLAAVTGLQLQQQDLALQVNTFNHALKHSYMITTNDKRS